jgi:O-antigen ligase
MMDRHGAPASESAAPTVVPGPGRVETGLRRAILVVAIGLSCLLGYYTTPVLLVLMALALPFTFRAMPLDTAGRMFGAGFMLLALSALFTTRSMADFLPFVGFGGLILYTPLARLFARAATTRNIIKVADFGLFGAASALLVALYYAYVEGQPRAALGAVLTDPIRLADTALILGFIAMMGAAAQTERHRYIYGLGPILALAVIFLSGSRAALIAFPVLVGIAALMLVRRKWLALGMGVFVLFGFAVVFALADLIGMRSSTLTNMVQRIVAGAYVGDLATTIRLVLYRAAIPAFNDAPLFGHGWGHVMSAIVPYLASYELSHAQLPHLHNDALQFAVAAGLPGLIAYPILLATPLVATLRSARDGQYRTRLYGAVLLTISSLVLGLPDTMLSFSLHITLYVVLTAMLLNYCRDRAV